MQQTPAYLANVFVQPAEEISSTEVEALLRRWVSCSIRVEPKQDYENRIKAAKRGKHQTTDDSKSDNSSVSSKVPASQVAQTKKKEEVLQRKFSFEVPLDEIDATVKRMMAPRLETGFKSNLLNITCSKKTSELFQLAGVTADVVESTYQSIADHARQNQEEQDETATITNTAFDEDTAADEAVGAGQTGTLEREDYGDNEYGAESDEEEFGYEVVRNPTVVQSEPQSTAARLAQIAARHAGMVDIFLSELQSETPQGAIMGVGDVASFAVQIAESGAQVTSTGVEPAPLKDKTSTGSESIIESGKTKTSSGSNVDSLGAVIHEAAQESHISMQAFNNMRADDLTAPNIDGRPIGYNQTATSFNYYMTARFPSPNPTPDSFRATPDPPATLGVAMVIPADVVASRPKMAEPAAVKHSPSLASHSVSSTVRGWGGVAGGRLPQSVVHAHQEAALDRFASRFPTIEEHHRSVSTVNSEYNSPDYDGAAQPHPRPAGRQDPVETRQQRRGIGSYIPWGRQK